MRRAEIAQLDAFLALARDLNFRRTAARLGLSPSALSKTIRLLEERVGTRLLNRTTRSVALTEAGRQLAEQTAPAFESIRQAMDDAGSAGRDPAGLVRINLPQLAGQLVFAPALGRLAQAYPRIRLELVVEDAMSDVILQGCDAGVRLGPAVQQDMVAVPVSEALHTVIVASPAYLARHAPPRHPRELSEHACLNYRWSATGALYRWVLRNGKETVDFGPEGRFIVNDTDLLVRAALGGAGLAMILEERVGEHLADGSLVRLLEDWTPTLPAFFLYHPGGRHVSPALRAVVGFFRMPG